MLKTRILTAIVLLSVFLVALFFFPPLGWMLLATGVAAIGAWEWGGLMRLGNPGRIALAASMTALCLGLATAFPAAVGIGEGFAGQAWTLGAWIYPPATLFWLLAVPLWMKGRWSLPKSWAGVAIGFLVIVPTWLAFIQLRQAGASILFAALAAVWLADTAAYFSGRAFGRHKLAPSISPGKTWEGVAGGVAVVVAGGFAFAANLPAALVANSALFAVGLVLVAGISVIGDLFESLLKRQAGLKDSSAILPGHGGILDRIDSLTSTLPLVALFWFGFGAAA